MSEEFGPNFITLTDDDGNDIELEYVDALELDGQTYMAFFPVVEDDADEEAAEEYGLVILKSVMENGEELLSTLDSDEELDKVYDLFMEQILSDEEEGFFVLPMTGRRRLSRKIDWIFRQDEARRCSHTLCMAKRRNEVLAQETRRYLLVPTKNMPMVFGPVWLPITGPM